MGPSPRTAVISRVFGWILALLQSARKYSSFLSLYRRGASPATIKNFSQSLPKNFCNVLRAVLLWPPFPLPSIFPCRQGDITFARPLPRKFLAREGTRRFGSKSWRSFLSASLYPQKERKTNRPKWWKWADFMLELLYG